jgi:hypothetical protein
MPNIGGLMRGARRMKERGFDIDWDVGRPTKAINSRRFVRRSLRRATRDVKRLSQIVNLPTRFKDE